MVDDNKHNGLDALMGLSPSEKQPEKEEIKEEQSEQELPQEEQAEEPQEQEEQVEEKSEKDQELEKALKRFEDTKAWGNQAHQTAKELQKILEENDLLTDDVKQRLEAVDKGSSEVTEDKAKEFEKEFLQQIELVKGVVFTEDEDPEQHLKAFSKIYGNMQTLQELSNMEPADRIKHYVSKAKQAMPIAQAMEATNGDVAAAMELLAEKKAKKLFKEYKSSEEYTEDDTEEVTPRQRPRVNGTNTPKSTTYKRQTLTNLTNT